MKTLLKTITIMIVIFLLLTGTAFAGRNKSQTRWTTRTQTQEVLEKKKTKEMSELMKLWKEGNLIYGAPIPRQFDK